jgi:S1-C subfamily serine protease
MMKFQRRSTDGWPAAKAPWLYCLVFLLTFTHQSAAAQGTSLPDIIAKIKPSVVAVGTFQKTRRPPALFRGTGFVIGDGSYVATNAHVLPEKLDQEKNEIIAVFAGNAKTMTIYRAIKTAEDRDHDLVILRIDGPALSALSLGDSASVREGENYVFSGFPIGMVLGLNAVTHRALIAAITPIVIPQLSAPQIEKKTLARLIAPYDVFQLDATAYPGNSGSPLYHPDTGQVVGIINKTFVQQTKESVMQQPSGISYAIPINHLHELMKKNQMK